MASSGNISAWLLIIITVECIYGGSLNYRFSEELLSSGDTKSPARFGHQKPQKRDIQESQSKQTVEMPLTWKFPVTLEAKPESKFEQWEPVPAESVAVQCSETGVHVEVRQNLLGNNQLIQPADLHLGGCEATQVDTANQLIIYESDLYSCGSQQMVRKLYYCNADSEVLYTIMIGCLVLR